MNCNDLQHWKLDCKDDGIAYLQIDVQDKSTNVLSAQVLDELNLILDHLCNDAGILTGLIVYSGKQNGFLAGADVSEFTQLHTREEVTDLILRGQTIFRKLEKLHIPSVAAIHGFCLGGGLELALSCTYRIGVNSPDCKLGLPEVQLGIHPGYGGTVRLPERIGLIAAMRMMLNGRSIKAWQAKKNGLVDEIVPHRLLLSTAKQWLLHKPAKTTPPRMESLLQLSLPRKAMLYYLRRQIQTKVHREHYPAPYQLLDLFQERSKQREQAFEEEANSVVELFDYSQTKQLIRLFTLRERLKAIGKNDFSKIEHVHVIGAGLMGGDIACWCALHGCRVSLQDQSEERIASALHRARNLIKKRIREPHLVQEVMDRLIADVDGKGIASAELIIEAIFENKQVKQDLFKSIEPKMRDEAILASNTSSIPLEELASVLQNPQRLIGLHFFNPVAKMQLVEVIAHANANANVLQRGCTFTAQIKKLPLIVQSSPGFLVNRVLMPYLLEACMLVDEGIAPEAIDTKAREFGMPMGPVELADTVGLDICLSVAKTMQPVYQLEIPKTLIQLNEQQHLGRKSGQGFYQWKDGKPQRNSKYSDSTTEDIQDRIMLALINEAVKCVQENLVEDTDLLDAGIVFGTGFAPFRGGPIEYIRSTGIDTLLHRLSRLEKLYGPRFHPSQAWQSLNNDGKT